MSATRNSLTLSQARSALGELRTQLTTGELSHSLTDAAWLHGPGRVHLHLTLRDPPPRPIALALPSSAGGGHLQPLVSLGGGGDPRTLQDLGDSLRDSLRRSVSAMLHPGAAVQIEDPANPNAIFWAGVACFLAVNDEPHLLTAGHVFPPGVAEAPVFKDGETVATLRFNLLEPHRYHGADRPRLDGALCALTDEGREAASNAIDHDLWSHDPMAPISALHQGSHLTFYPSNRYTDVGAQMDLEVLAPAWDTTIADNRWRADLKGLIKAAPKTRDGDSGSLAILKGSGACALCNGRTDASYFTPITALVSELQASYGIKKVKPWRPTQEESSLRLLQWQQRLLLR